MLGDQCEYDSEMGQERWELNIPDVRVAIVPALHQDGRYLSPSDSSSTTSGGAVDDWVHSSWASTLRDGYGRTGDGQAFGLMYHLR